MSYISSLLDKMNDDTYSWEHVSDPGFRAGLGVEEQAGNELSGANGFVGMDDAKAERIAQIRKRLAEIAQEKKKYNMEEEIGKYKFLYDNDPSVLMNYKQNLRNAEATEKIRKATEDATKASNAQSMWKSNQIDLEVAKAELASAKDNYTMAKANGNEEGMRKAALDQKNARIKINRLEGENKALRSKFATQLGLTDKAEDEALELNNVDTGLDLEGDIGRVNELKTLNGELDRLDKAYKVDNMPIAKGAKTAKVKQGLAEVAKAEASVKSSNIDESKKQDMLTKLAEIKNNIVNFGKPSGKGGQGTVMTKEDYTLALKGLNPTQIRSKGSRWLGAAKKAGVPGLDQYIKEAIAEGK